MTTSPTSTYENRRKYKKEPYLRAEHLLVKGRYVATKKRIADVVYNCPKKIIGSKEMGEMIGIAFDGTDKVLGLCATNESMLCHVTGSGSPASWIGKEILLVVRLAGNKKEPSIRIWGGKGNAHPNNRVREQMGDEITEQWYKDHVFVPEEGGTQEPEKPKPTETKPADKPAELTDAKRAEWIAKCSKSMDDAKTSDDIAKCRTDFTSLGIFLSKHEKALTSEEREALADKLREASVRVDQAGEKPKDALV